MEQIRKIGNTKIGYVVKKVCIFAIIYAISAITMEGIVILFFSLQGYDVLHGVLPEAKWVDLVPLYGFIGFGIVTYLELRFIEKKEWSFYYIEFTPKHFRQFLIQLGYGAGLVLLMTLLFVILGDYELIGFQMELGQIKWLLLTFGAYLIQGSVEEFMCRGFLQNILCVKIKRRNAIIVTAIIFLMPHLGTIGMMSWKVGGIAILNLILVSILFSLLMEKDHNLFSACGFHVGWNYMLGCVLGLQVSGGDGMESIINLNVTGQNKWLTGGEYGIEASVLLTAMLLITNIGVYHGIKKKRNDERRRHGFS